MKRWVAHVLRSLANRLDHIDELPVRLKVTYNGDPVDMEKMVVTALANHARRTRGIA
jgi:hypothetical protein